MGSYKFIDNQIKILNYFVYNIIIYPYIFYNYYEILLKKRARVPKPGDQKMYSW